MDAEEEKETGGVTNSYWLVMARDLLIWQWMFALVAFWGSYFGFMLCRTVLNNASSLRSERRTTID